MTGGPGPTSRLGPVIARYVALKTALGRRYALEQRTFDRLDAFLRAEGGAAGDLTSTSFTRWTRTLHHLTATVRRNRLRVVRNLCLYRRRTEPTCFVPDPSLFPAPHQARAPYIFTAAEIARLIDGTRRLAATPDSPLRSQVFRLALTLLYTTGLRRGELLRLTVDDYDPRERVLQIRASKFHKSRLVPLSPDASREVDRYVARCRRQFRTTSGAIPLIAHGPTARRPYTGVGFGHGVRDLFRQLAIHTAEGRLPRVHDLRHTFAVHALLRWYRMGADLQAKLPLLSTYMGHISIASTSYYLAFVEPLRAAASARFDQHCGALVDARARRRGRR
jgi:integrase/recombinase XerD